MKPLNRRLYNYKDTVIFVLGNGVTERGQEFVLYSDLAKKHGDHGSIINCSITEFTNHAKLIDYNESFCKWKEEKSNTEIEEVNAD